MAELTSMRNIGKALDDKLKSVDIQTAEDLIELGSKEAFFRLKTRYPNACLVFLYTLQGAIDDVDYNRLPDDIKQDLKNFNETLK